MKLVSGNDVVYTPVPLAKHIVDYFKPRGSVLEPCRGGGAFYDYLCETNCGEDDITNWCEIEEGPEYDFFNWDQTVGWIVTNPPWSLMRKFLNHSMELANDIVMLALFTHFTTRARYNDIISAGFGLKEALLVPTPKKPWPQSGFQLVAMHIQRHWDGPLTMTNHNHLEIV